MARLINAFGVELCKIYNEPTLPAEGKTATWSMFEQIAPYLLKLLANENNDISTTVFFSVNDMLSIVSSNGIKYIRVSFFFFLDILIY